jgi:exosome complex exonuclease DIS3/RRP44
MNIIGKRYAYIKLCSETYVKRDKDESPNDRNDRAIRRATEWYDQHLKSGIVNKEMSAILLTDDLDNKLKARQQGLRAYSVREYVEAMTAHPELMDMIANVEEEDLDNKKFCYDEHLTPIQISAGLTAGTLYQGTMAINPHNFLQGSIFANIDGEERTVTIHGRLNLNRAINGDIVAVQLLPKEEWKAAILDQSVLEEEDVEEEQEDQSMAIDTPEQDIDEESSVVQPVGKVVGIIKKNWRPYAGNIDSNSLMTGTFTVSTQNVWFWPMDKRIPRIRIRTRQVKALVGKRIIVAIDSWSRTSKHPSGHFVKIVGEVGEKKTETEVLLHEHDVPYAPFSQNVLACLPSEGESWIVTDKELPGRRDFRHLDVCSIDPPGCTDIDDALHARLLPNGNYEVGVHIADVSHFVKANTPMDTEASRRGTTVYLVDKRIDMLPGLLGTNLCSLRSHVDRLSFSCIWEMTPEAEIVDVQFTKSIIRSRHSFTYDEAQARLDDPNAKDPVSLGIKLLDKLAKQLRQRRMDRGALVLASPEVRFKLENDSQDPVDVEMKELKDTNALVEEFMLLANISVAKKIVGHFPESSMLRRHPKPPNSNFDGLKRAAARFGFNISAETSKHLADSLDLAMIPDEPYFNKLIRIMTTRCMMQAVYFSSGTVADVDYWHYGLATEIYTHFTSPIRRYADLIVHRLLAACIGYEKVYSTDLTDKSRMSEISDNLNYRHRQAQQASRSSVELYTNLYFRNKTVEEEAFVIRVVKNGFIVLIPK